MFITILILCFAITIIYLSSELFVNGIEWVGARFNIARSAVGTVLAAVGTALPESIVTFVAVAFSSSPTQQDIGIGAALGGPLVLGTIAYAVVGVCIVLFRRRRSHGTSLDIDSRKLAHDQLWFIAIFVFKVLLGLIVFTAKRWTSLLFLAAYGLYFYREIGAKPECDTCKLEPLRFQPRCSNPRTIWILGQTLLALAMVFMGSQLFVHYLGELSRTIGISPLVVALILSPVATELPEILNAVIWVRQGKETLALGNISGAMMIQATVPSAFGIFFTPWLFDSYLIVAGVVTLLSVIFLLFTLRNKQLSPGRLSLALVFYLLFAVLSLLINQYPGLVPVIN